MVVGVVRSFQGGPLSYVILSCLKFAELILRFLELFDLILRFLILPYLKLSYITGPWGWVV